MKKRILSVLLTICCLLTLLPTTASAAKGGKLIALTFDDGPCSYTRGLLDGLAERDVKVTFFILGQSASTYSDTIRRAYREGHQIAQHTYDHVQLSAKDNDEIARQLSTTDNTLNNILGKNFTYVLRPPYGDYNSRVLEQIGRPAVNWSIDPVDWRDRNSDTVCNRIVGSAFDGAIILCHDIHATTIPGALRAIDILQDQGYEFVTVNELYRRRGVEMENGKLYTACKNNGTDLGPVEVPEMTYTSVYGGRQITLKAQSGTKIYYTLDGSDPAENGTLYTRPFVAPTGQKLKYLAAYDLNGSRSETVTKTVEGDPAEDPSLKLKDGKFVFENPNPDTDIYYRTDGGTASSSSTKYTGPFDAYEGKISYCVMGMGIGTASKTYYISKNGNLFLDVAPGNWYFDEIDFAVTKGLINGVAPQEYAPDDGLTRAMFVTLLYRLLSGKDLISDGIECSFTDLEQDAWYEEPVLWAARNGVVNGYEDGSFRPDQRINREEMCVTLDRLLTLLNKNVEGDELTFSDTERISSWAAESVARLVKTGIIRGQENNRFAPASTTTRAEAATVLHRLYDLTVGKRTSVTAA